jgi:hypothetical protein
LHYLYEDYDSKVNNPCPQVNLIKLITLSALTLLLSSCGLTYKILLGVDTTPRWNTDEQIVKQAKKYNIPAEYNLVLDTTSFTKDLKKVYKEALQKINITNGDSSSYHNLKKARNDDFQPTQFRLFDQNGSEIFKIVNCYVDAPPIDWNVEGCFDSFPPVTPFETLNIHLFDLDFLLTHASYIDNHKLSFDALPKAEYYCVILWNEFMKRPSKRLIKTVSEYLDKFDPSIVLIYINSQNQVIWPSLDAEEKEKVKALYTNN